MPPALAAGRQRHVPGGLPDCAGWSSFSEGPTNRGRPWQFKRGRARDFRCIHSDPPCPVYVSVPPAGPVSPAPTAASRSRWRCCRRSTLPPLSRWRLRCRTVCPDHPPAVPPRPALHNGPRGCLHGRPPPHCPRNGTCTNLKPTPCDIQLCNLSLLHSPACPSMAGRAACCAAQVPSACFTTCLGTSVAAVCQPGPTLASRTLQHCRCCASAPSPLVPPFPP